MVKTPKKITVYDPTKTNKENVVHLCYLLTEKSLKTLAFLVKQKIPTRTDAYTARHLVDKKLAFRIANGKKSLYKATFLGECVVEVAEEEGKL